MLFNPKSSLRRILVFAFALISLAAVFTISVLNAYSTYQANRQSLITELSKSAQIIALRVDGYMGEIISAIAAGAKNQSDTLFDKSPEVSHTAITRVLASHRGVRAVWSINQEGNIQGYASRFTISAADNKSSLWNPVKQSNKIITQNSFNEIHFTELSREPLIDIAIPITRGGNRPTGTVVVTLSLKYLWDLLSDLQPDPEQNVYTYDRNGKLIGHSDQGQVYQIEAVPLDVINYFFRSPTHTTREYLSKNDQAMLAGFSRIEKLDFGIVIETPKSKALELAFSSILSLLMVSLLIAIISIIAGRSLAKIIVHPIQQLSEAAEKVANTQTVLEVDTVGTVETQKLSKAFNKMVHRLNATIIELKLQIVSKEKSQIALQESEQRFRLIAENLPEVFWLGNLEDPKNYRLLYVNPAFEETWQISREDLFKNPSLWQECIHPDDADRVRASVRAFTRGQAGFNEVYRIIPKDGVEKTLRVTAHLIRNEHGQVIQDAGIARDITEFRKTEQALRRSQKMDAIGQLTGGIAHDFNNILGIILGNLDLLEHQTVANSAIHSRVTTIKKSAHRAADLTRQLLGFSRRQTDKLTNADINSVIGDMESLITRSITPKIEVEYALTEAIWTTTIDIGDFQDALLNLTINARDAMGDSGHLIIETSNCNLDATFCQRNPDVTPGDYVLLVVSDDGEGIPYDQQEHIFEPFFTTKPQGKGTGLGLSMVFGFIKRTLGHIRVYSEVGIGTAFQLYLPRADVDTLDPLPSSIATSIEERPSGAETILIVDDEVDLVEIAQVSLQQLGYQVITANNGQQALSQLSNRTDIALMFSDVVMPGGIDGYELSRQALERHPALKILLTSGYTAKANSSRSEDESNYTLLSKPYSQDNLAKEIRTLLGEPMQQINQVAPIPQNVPQPLQESLIEWTEDLSMGIDVIDDDHKKVVELLNRCQQTATHDKEELNLVLDELLAFAGNHFTVEETIMAACSYPGLANHRQVHQLLTQQVTEILRRTEQGVTTLEDLVSFLNSWLVDHIQGMDRSFSVYCMEKPELINKALIALKEKPE